MSQTFIQYLLHGMPHIQGSVRCLLGTEGEEGGVHKCSGRLAGSIGSHCPEDCLHLMGSQGHHCAGLQECREDVAVHLYCAGVHV